MNTSDLAREAAEAVSLIDLKVFDALPVEQHAAEFRKLWKSFLARTGCSIPTAKRHIAHALRRRRYEDLPPLQRGGVRPGAGAPAGNRNAVRQSPSRP